MGHTLTVRLTPQLAAWLERQAKTCGVAQGQIIREQLERARAAGHKQSFMRLAGAKRGAPTLSTRKGFSRT